jgi:RNA polymerase sigma factor (sigma-70 family)
MSERAALAVVLFMAGGGIGLPVIVLIWFVASTLASGAMAEGLEQTRGLEPTTFGGGYWLAAGANALVLLWSLVRRLRRRPAPWSPLALLSGFYVLSIWIAVFPDLADAVDVPDVLTTFVLLGADSLVSYLFPFLLLALLVRGLVHLWRLAGSSSAAALQVGVTTICLGLSAMTLGVGLALVDLQPKTLDVAIEEFVSSLDVAGVEGERRGYAALSLGLGSGLTSAEAAASHTSSAFGKCAETLAERRPYDTSDARSVVERGTARLIRIGLGKADAEDVAMDTLLRVCLEHAKNPLDDPATYYSRALRNNASSLRRHVNRGNMLSYDEDVPDVQALSAAARMDLNQQMATLRAAMARLSLADQHVLELRYVDGLSYADIGKRMGKTEAAARQQVKRTRDRLEQAWAREQYRH